MRLVEPEVQLIAETKLNVPELKSALRTMGNDTAVNWFDATARAAESDGELLTEVAGRVCYMSFGIGINPNITKIRTDSGEYITNTLKKGDGSIFEHATCTFAFMNVSRVFTHELVRHRAGIAVSQLSMRYVRPGPEGLGFWMPPGLTEEQKAIIVTMTESVERGYRKLEKTVDWEGSDFANKKVLTSALRRPLPNGVATHIIWTANHRTIRHVINMRTAESAEIEIRLVFDKVARKMKARFPLIYADFQSKQLEDGTTTWIPAHPKV